MKKKYSIVLKKNCNKEEFKSDLSGISSLEFIPNRECNISDIVDSRALFTELTDEEVSILKNDSRIYDIQQTIPFVKVEPAVIVHSSGLKLQTKFDTNSYINIEDNINDVLFNAQALTEQAYISNLPDGSGVDVVIVDGLICSRVSYSTNLGTHIVTFHNTDIHPEFLDSDGNSRLELINWNAYVGEPGSYPYQALVESYQQADNNQHGVHVAGTACGKKLGWAKNSKIFNITPLGGSLINENKHLIAIKNWHLSKTNNRPTVTNHSYGQFLPPFDTRYINKVTIDGTQHIAPRETERAIIEVLSVTPKDPTNPGVGGQIASWNIVNSGNGYTNRPDISFNGGGGDEASLTMASGTIKEILITNIGSGYSSSIPPNIVFSISPNGQTASGVCSVNSNGSIDSVDMIEWGSGYDSAPTATFDDPVSGATATATTTIGSNFIKTINILNSAPGLYRENGSVGYDPPFVIISDGDCVKEALWVFLPEYYYSFRGIGSNGFVGQIRDGMYKIASKKTNINSTSFKYTLLGGEYNSIPNVSFKYMNPSSWQTASYLPGPHAYGLVNNEGRLSEVVVSFIQDSSRGGMEPDYGWFTSIPQVYVSNGGGFTEQTLENWGIIIGRFYNGADVEFLYPTYMYYSYFRDIITDSIIEDLIEENIIVVASAGNFQWNIQTPGSIGYDTNLEINVCENIKDNPSIMYEDNLDNFFNYLEFPAIGVPWGDNVYNIFPLQGSSPGSASGVICVGSMSIDSTEKKSDFSSAGTRVDIYAAGSRVPSANIWNRLLYRNKFVLDHVANYPYPPAENAWGIIKMDGTSMASPQVCGAIACYLTEGNIARSADLIEQVTQWIKDNGVPALSTGAYPYDLYGGSNKILHFPNITVNR